MLIARLPELSRGFPFVTKIHFQGFTMKIIVFSARSYDSVYLKPCAEENNLSISFVETRLNAQSASMAQGYDVVCAFVNDVLDREVFSQLKEKGIQLVAMRCAGYNNCDLKAAEDFDIPVVRVPEYSPHSVAEHTFALILGLVRRIPKAFNRVREGNFELNGLMGFDLNRKTIGVVGIGKIGREVVKIANGFGMKVLGYDPFMEDDIPGVTPVGFEDLIQQSDIVTLHCPLSPKTQHLIDFPTLQSMKPGALLINTSRGGLVDTSAIIKGLKERHLGGLGIDVYENEAGLFFNDRSEEILDDDIFTRLLTFPNVIVTGHQGFFTREAMSNIASATIQSVCELRSGNPLSYQIQPHPAGSAV